MIQDEVGNVTKAVAWVTRLGGVGTIEETADGGFELNAPRGPIKLDASLQRSAKPPECWFVPGID